MPSTHPRDSRPSKPSASLYVRGVAEECRSEDLKELFGQFGPVKDVYIPLDYYTRQSRGFAYVQFEEVRDAEDAIDKIQDTRLHGKSLEVEFAQGDRKTPHDMKGKERRGGGGRYGSERYGSRRYSRSRSRDRDRDRDRRRSRSGDRYRDRERRRSVSPRRRSRSRSRSPRRSYRRSPERRNGR